MTIEWWGQMKINGFQPHNIYAAFSKDQKEQQPLQETSGQTEHSDRVEISAEAAGRNEAEQLARKITDASDDTGRAEHLDAIKERVRNGTYQVAAEQVAGSILGRQIDQQA